MDLKAVAAVGLSVDHVHQVVVLLLRLSVAARPVVPRPAALLIAHKRGRVVDEARLKRIVNLSRDRLVGNQRKRKRSQKRKKKYWTIFKCFWLKPKNYLPLFNQTLKKINSRKPSQNL